MPFPTLPSPPQIFTTYLTPGVPFRRRSGGSAATASPASPTAAAAAAAPPSPAGDDDDHHHHHHHRHHGDRQRRPPSPPSYLSGSSSHLRCATCLTDLCLTSQIISKGFTGRYGRAYLGWRGSAAAAPSSPSSPSPAPGPAAGRVRNARARDADALPNTHVHRAVPRQLVTGAHTVSDISCAVCGSVLGWKYVAAEDEAQRYKVGKFILETKRVCRGVCWENGPGDGPGEEGGAAGRGGAAGAEREEDVEFDSQDEDECEDLFAGVWSPALARKRRRNR
ncbi:yippee zinc-binding/DNA-binding /Mis18, centromere assembly-domain-containing protein, partial [Lineolata rhizophorae]